MKTSRAIGFVCLSLLLACMAIVPPAAAGEPEELLASWAASLDQGDYAAYAACLHSGARAVPEYGSQQAMTFWTAEMNALEARGFTGRYQIVPAPTGAPRLPTGALLAYPIVDAGPIEEPIVLIEEAGSWKILRLFS